MRFVGSLPRWLLGFIALALLPFGLDEEAARAGAVEPSIAIINPVDDGPVVVVSDKPTANSTTYSLVAWTADAPEGDFFVEFVFEGSGYTLTLLPERRVGGTWSQPWWRVPEEMMDGPYLLTARLRRTTGELVAEDRVNVTVRGSYNGGADPGSAVTGGAHVPPGNGFYDPPGFRMGTYEYYFASAGTQQVRMVYSKTLRGGNPRWIRCGHAPTEPEDPYAGYRNASVRCALAAGDEPSQVTLLGGIANDTPPGAEPDPLRDGASTVTSPDPYIMRPTALWAEWADSDGQPGGCYVIHVDARDQRRAGLWHAPIDLHLSGSSGEVSFGTVPWTDRLRAPDGGGHLSSQPARECLQDHRLSSQARHSDGSSVHSEIVGGAGAMDGLGNATAGVYTSAGPSTRFTTWIDIDEDDVRDANEPSDVIVWHHDRTISLRSSRSVVPSGATVKLSGSLDGWVGTCNEGRLIVLHARRSRTHAWRQIAEVRTDMWGNYVVPRRIWRSTYLRVDGPYEGDFCEPAASRVIRVVVR